MRREIKSAFLVLLLTGLVLPQAVAHTEQDESTVPGILDDSDLSGATPFYIVVDAGGDDMGIELWEETNDHAGLQTSKTIYTPDGESCHGGSDTIADGRCTTPPDFGPIQLI